MSRFNDVVLLQIFIQHTPQGDSLYAMSAGVMTIHRGICIHIQTANVPLLSKKQERTHLTLPQTQSLLGEQCTDRL